MYFSFKYTSDLIVQSLEMFHVHSSCISNLKKHSRQYLTKESAISKYRVEPESKKSIVNDLLN